jgi:cytochrome c oxidase assembly factor CtaG
VSGLTSAWDPAPAVLVGVGFTAVLFVRGFVRLRRRGRHDHAPWSRAVLFALALAGGTLPLVSPLDEIGDSYLLSGHVLQHVLIGDVAPALALVALRGPLLFFVLPSSVLRCVARLAWLRQALAFLLRARTSLAAWMLVIAAWHVPAAYDYALRHPTVHELEHVSFIAAGLLVWSQIVDPTRRNTLRPTQRVGCMVAMTSSALLLGGILLVASPLFPAYAHESTRLFGLSPSRDQHLAGLVMIGAQLAALGLCAWLLLVRRESARAAFARRRFGPPAWTPSLESGKEAH